MKLQVQPVFGYLAFWMLLIAFHQGRFPATIVLALVMLAGFLSAMWRTRQPVRERASALMSELFGILYLALFLYPAVPVRYDFGDKTGLHWFLILLAVIWMGDTAALVAGKTFGKSRFAPVSKPQKNQGGSNRRIDRRLCCCGSHAAFPFSRSAVPSCPDCISPSWVLRTTRGSGRIDAEAGGRNKRQFAAHPGTRGRSRPHG